VWEIGAGTKGFIKHYVSPSRDYPLQAVGDFLELFGDEIASMGHSIEAIGGKLTRVGFLSSVSSLRESKRTSDVCRGASCRFQNEKGEGRRA